MRNVLRRAGASDEHESGTLKIGEVSKLSGVGVEALRFYERSGLLGRPGRTSSGYRLYGREVLERLDFIRRAQVLGFSLEEIGRVIAEREAGRSPCAEVRQVVERRLEELDERLAQMKRYRKELVATLAEWEQTGEADGHVCGLIEGAEIRHAPVAVRATLGGHKRRGRKKGGRHVDDEQND